MEKFKGKYLFMVFAENFFRRELLFTGISEIYFPNCAKIMDTTMFIAWFKFHSISGSAKNLAYISFPPLDRYKIHHADFFPKEHLCLYHTEPF